MKTFIFFLCMALCQIQYSNDCLATNSKDNSAYSLSLPLGKLQYEHTKLNIGLDKDCPSSIEGNPVFWAVRIQNLSDYSSEIIFSSKGQNASVIKTEKGFQLKYEKLVKDGKSWDISLTLDFNTTQEAFLISGNIKNNTVGWAILDFTGPVISGIQADLHSFPLLMPCGYGQKFVSTPTEQNPIDKVSMKGALTWKRNKSSYYEISAAYPSRFATMQWCVLGGKNGGLYFGSHDPQFGAKRFSIRYYPDNNTLGLTFIHEFVCHTGESTEIPPLTIMPYTGTWHAAANYYRAWFDTALTMPDIPHWAKNSGGWMLTIMKQQNEEIMWKYDDLDEMSQIAGERGLDILGLYGWAHGGHDRFYPDYFPDESMGGREALKDALKAIRNKGLRSIIYVNGQLIDRHGTDYWEETGQHITVKKQSGELDYQRWWKYRDAPARYHGMACLGCDAWYQRMLELAIQANELGADGIIYDQLAVTAPKYCYADNHGHAVPSIVYTSDRYRLLDRIANYMKTINPDFIVMTEGLCDAVLSSVSFFHGYSNAVYVPLQYEWDARQDGSAPTYIYPEMFKYTFSEVLTTTRNPAPVNNRLILNYATVYGMRQELESRYAADVSYLKENKIPKIEDYDNIVSKPNLDLVTSEDPIASKIYTKQVIDFQRAHANIFWQGKYMDELGFTISASPSIIAKSYRFENKLGVIVWNSSDHVTEPLIIEVPGYTLDYVCEPEGANIVSTNHLNPQSIRLYIWTKKY